MAPEALLFQTGYLTMKHVETDPGGRPRYRLGYPNHEVRQSLNESLLDALAPNAAARSPGGDRLHELWWSWRAKARRWRSSGHGATRTSTAP